MTFVTPEPYIGHLGLDGVGDTKGLMESEFRERHIKWITNARVTSVAERSVTVEEVDEDGKLRRTHELPSHYTMLLPAFRGVAAVRGIEGLTNPRGIVLVDKHQRNPAYPEHLRRRRLRRHPADGADAGAGGRAENRLHDRIDGHGDGAQHWIDAARPGAARAGDVERRLPGRLRQRRRRLRGAAADPAAQLQLVRRAAPGCISPRLRSRNTSCARCARGSSEPFYEKLPAADDQRRQAEGHEIRSCVKNSAMTNATTIVCPHCAALNRVPADRPALQAKCGGCHKALFDGQPAAVDEAGFERHLQHDGIPILLDVWAPWCGPCRSMAPMFQRAAAVLEPGVRLLKLNSDESPRVSAQLRRAWHSGAVPVPARAHARPDGGRPRHQWHCRLGAGTPGRPECLIGATNDLGQCGAQFRLVQWYWPGWRSAGSSARGGCCWWPLPD